MTDYKFEIGQEVEWMTLPGIVAHVTGRKVNKVTKGNIYSINKTTGWIYETALREASE